jgi:hypothetical protein
MNKQSLIFLVTTGLMLGGCVATVTPIGPPPPPQVEVIGVSPYGDGVWTAGVWVWDPQWHQYHWHHGYWHHRAEREEREEHHEDHDWHH